MKDVAEDLIGKQLGPYHLVAIIGKGGMGVVYKAYEAKLTRYVALKVLSRRYAEDLEFVSRFWQEARAAANLEHPHILPVYAYGEHERYHYIAMQLVREGSLANLLTGRPLLLKQMGHIINQVGSALDYAHLENVIHRDVKPDNILISRHSGCLLTDFGIAKLLETTARHTQTGISFGTPSYMSPEQISADENLDGRSDIYSLGVLLYEMATGHLPFEGTVQAIQMQHLTKPPPPPREFNPDLPNSVVEVILKALAKKPDDRFATAGEMASALSAASPQALVTGGDGAAAILEAAPGTLTAGDQASESGEPMNSEELTAVLEATSGLPSVAERRRSPTEPVPVVGQTGQEAEVDRPRKMPALVWAAGLVLLAVVGAGVIGLGGLSNSLFRRVDTPTVVAGAGPGATETPTAVGTLPPTQTSAPQAAATATPEPTATGIATATPEAGETATPTPVPPATPSATPAPTRSATATPEASPTATSEPSPTVTQTTRPAAPDLSGRLAIPLMYGNEPKVYIVSTGGELETIVGAARQPDYSRDGARLIVNGEGGTWDKLRVSDAAGGAAYEIGDPALAGHSYPSWSPEGAQVIYDDGTVDPRGWRIFIRDLNTNGPGTGAGTMLRAGVGQGELIGRNPLWTSEDRFIFRGCNTWQPGMESECGIWLMQGNAGEPERLTNSPNHVPSDVRSDRLVYASAEAGDWNVYSLDLASGATRQLTEDTAADGLATISPDGRSVAFLSNRGGRLAVWTVPMQGGTAQKLFDLPSEWGGLRADGWAEEKLSWGAR